CRLGEEVGILYGSLPVNAPSRPSVGDGCGGRGWIPSRSSDGTKLGTDHTTVLLVPVQPLPQQVVIPFPTHLHARHINRTSHCGVSNQAHHGCAKSVDLELRLRGDWH